MKKAFRKYHRMIGIIVALPLTLTVLTGMAATIGREWPLNLGISSRFMLKVHTGEIFHLQAIYPILNGLGMLGLLVTGLSMSGLFGRRKQQNSND
ncbi:peptidase [Microcoleus sp. LEGE 07076]|uniref:peptidase n=1 Tax=Microcoleus sp. LEGE 07076 TaxID=915322 RepID=UPI0018814F91|nr:peptidase [Microcoleus sp. LEGE 07076]MBE9184817.1 peptidase [Microcoleus sp. LEGE 07076]